MRQNVPSTPYQGRQKKIKNPPFKQPMKIRLALAGFPRATSKRTSAVAKIGRVFLSGAYLNLGQPLVYSLKSPQFSSLL
jgi:hypothetical protein